MATKSKIYQFTGGIVTDSKLTEVLRKYLSTTDNAEIVSWIESTETGIKFYMKDGKTEELTISQAKEFETVEYDKETNYLHFYDANGADVYDPVYIEGGSGAGTSSSSVVTLTNQNGTATFAIPLGTSLNLMFDFTSTENDIPTGNGTCQIFVNGVIKSTFSIEQGLTSVDVGPYLSSGSNSVRVRCTDVYGTYKTIIYTISGVSMYITSPFDASVSYSGDITYKFIPYGSIEKTIHILVDGDEIDTITTSTSGKQSTYIISALSHGTHTLEVYATAELDGNSMESTHLIYDIMCTESGNTSSMIASAYNITSVKQGEQISIPYIVLDPTKLACDISLDIYTMSSGSEVIYSTQELTVDRSQQYWNTRKYPVGTVYFRIKYGKISKIHTVTVAESDIKIEAETNDLELMLSSEGRSNNEANPGLWSYKTYSTKFENFNWKTNGWIDDENGDACLRLNGDARIEIQFKPFINDIRTYGKTIEMEFTIRDVNNRNATVISCLNDGIGFEMTADTAYLQSEQSKVFCKYKEDDDNDDVIDKVRIAFVVEARSEYRQLCVYLNGILSKEIQYPDTDNFQQTTPVNITIGSSSCGVDLYTIRSYGTALTSQQVNNNRIADIKDIVEKTAAYERNDIYDEYGNVSYEKCRTKNSVMVIIGDLPTYKGDKKTVKISYYDLGDSSLDFVDSIVVIDVQGTSSQYYPRKNWKLKCSTEHGISIDQILNKIFCIKVDYAEATGKHNTGNANFIHTLYDEQIPPQESNPLARTTIYGKPILLFTQANENADPVFYGKANLNFDKGSLEVFGFTDSYDVESWEFCNNTSDACNFLGPVPSIWVDDFEARYPEDYTDISRFKAMHDWVVSTNQNGATGSALSKTYTDANGKTYSIDTAEYRLAKFKTEFKDHFNMHYALIYYVWSFFALMVDQRAKNMFLTYWGNTDRWYPYFYDNDTCFGINNEGQLVFDYYHEDTDQIAGANVYNGQNSVLWNNFRMAFPKEIKETYQNLRTSAKLTFQKVKDNFITNHSGKWSESIYNEDAYAKYVQMLLEDGDATNLYQIRGEAEEHFEYFVENRFDFCDSKWYAGDYVSNYVSLRIYTPSTWSGVKPNADITTTYFSTIYAGVRYKANGTLYQEKVTAGVPVTFKAPNETFNDTETAIYGAHLISSLGDLAPLYAGSINVAAADKLIELKAGDSMEGYSNPNLTGLSVGTNKLMRLVNVCNCPNFTSVLDLSGCPSIEEVYATGSGITGVNFPEAGILRIAQLPATIANFTLKHQLYVEELTFEGYDEIKTLWVEDCPTVNGLDILNKSKNVNRLRLTGVNWSYDTAAEMLALSKRPIGGIDENGANVDTMWIDGTCHIKTLTGAEYLEIKEAFPYMNITYDALTTELIFMSEDGTTELSRQTIQNGGDGTYTGSTPTKSSTAQYHYAFAGWSLTAGGSADADALKAVEADRKVYAAFTSTLRSYTVKFYNGSTLLQTSTVKYGGTAKYTGSTPTNTSTGNVEDFEFSGWKPSPTNIQGDTNCYAQFYDLREITDDWATIAKSPTKYAVGAFKTLMVGEKRLPYKFYSGSAVVYNNEIHILGGGSSDSNTKHYKWDGTEWTSVTTLPYEFRSGRAVVYNNEIHILGSGSSDGGAKHYKYDGSNWTSVSTLPYKLYEGSAVVYNNEIHILGSDNSENYTKHYKYDGSSWTSVTTLPYEFRSGRAVVYNNEIHILGSGSSDGGAKHYKYDGSNWTSVSTLPYKFYRGCAVVHNNEIHILGGGSSGDNNSKHYKWDGTEWTSVTTLPYGFYKGSAVVYNNEIHILGSDNSDFYYYYSAETQTWSKYLTESLPMTVAECNHDEYPDGEIEWISSGTLPYKFDSGCAVVYNNEIHILGGGSSSDNNSKHYKWDGTEWTSVTTLPYGFYKGSAVVYNNEIHILGGGSSDSNTKHYKWDGTEWTSVSTLPYSFYRGSAVVYNNEIHILGSEDYLYSTAHYKYDGSTWTKVSTLPYGFYKGSAVVYNNEIHILGSDYLYVMARNHYKFDGASWTEVSKIPFNFGSGSAVVYNNEIHILGSENSSSGTAHYKYDGTEWTEGSILPYKFYRGCAVVHNNEIYVLGGYHLAEGHYKLTNSHHEAASTVPSVFSSASTKGVDNGILLNNDIHLFKDTSHYKWDGDNWTSASTLPYSFAKSSLVILNGEIHVLGGSANPTSHRKWNGTSWVSVSTLPYDFYLGSALVVDGEIHIMGGFTDADSSRTKHYKYNGSTWVSVSTLPYDGRNCSMVLLNGEIHMIGGESYAVDYFKHYKWNGSAWSEVSTLPVKISGKRAVILNSELHIVGSYDEEHANSHYKWTGTEWTAVASLPYPFKNFFYGVRNGKIHLIGDTTDATLGVQHYILSNPRASLTFIAKNLLLSDTDIGSSDTSKKGWGNAALRTWLNSTFLSTLPEDLQSALKSVKVVSDGGYGNPDPVVSNDKISILSLDELGAPVYDNSCQGDPYDIFTDNDSRIRFKVDSKFAGRYHTRTASQTEDGDYHYVDSDGSTGANKSHPANAVSGVLIKFCI